MPTVATVGVAATAESRRVQDVVDAVRQALAVSHEVTVALVEANPLKASVEPVKGAPGTFKLSIEQAFLEQLTPAELRAVVAHELGHVWIYTHHPYLQTEQLANQIAMQVVSRESLDSVYGKVWTDGGGPLPRFPETRTAAAEDAGPRD
jgi:Zn-dependent protease with chaperone function